MPRSVCQCLALSCILAHFAMCLCLRQVVDGEMAAELRWPDRPGLQGRLRASLQAPCLLPVARIRAVGDRCASECCG
jgi:hypothetical protein